MAVDELTGAMRRAGKRLFPDGSPADAAVIVSAAKAVKTIDEIACIRRAARITDEAMVDVQSALAPGSARSTCRPSSCVTLSNWVR